MSSKILNHIKKLIVALAIITICSTNVAYGFAQFNGKGTMGLNYYNKEAQGESFIDMIVSFFTNIFSIFTQGEEYSLEDLYNDLQKLLEKVENGENILPTEVQAYVDKLAPSTYKTQMTSTVNTYMVLSASGNSGFNIGSLIGSLMSLISPLVDGLMGLLGGGALKADEVKDLTIYSETAEAFANGYGVDLHATAYINNKADGKWALVIHPFLMSGKTMSNAVGKMYYEENYNILAIDLRGFGESKGTVALGFLESLDAYDWLEYMNTEEFANKCGKQVKEIIVHGTSLGAATTNFLSGINGFLNDNAAPGTKLQLKSLPNLKVVGLVEDCGYINMTEFADKSFIISLGMGLTDATYDYYSNAANSLKYCEVPMLVIHGDADTMVKPQNAKDIVKILHAKGLSASGENPIMISGGAHALIMMGKNDKYEKAVKDFIPDKAINQQESSSSSKGFGNLLNFGK